MVRIKVPARIHCGLINESGLFGRIDGGIGFTIDAPYWELDINESDTPVVDQHLPAELREAIVQVRDTLSPLFLTANLTVTPRQTIPAHVGFGSKTALVLAVGKAFCHLRGYNLSPIQLATIFGRGGTSGIGIHTFERGGFVWDAGRRYPAEKDRFGPSSLQLAQPPALLQQLHFDWLQVVHFRFDDGTLHGSHEVSIFEQFCPVPEDETRELYTVVAAQIVPALLEQHEPALQDGLRLLQTLGLKRVEWEQQPTTTQRFRNYWEQSGRHEALLLSSMGPTLVCLTHKPEEIVDIVRAFDAAPHALTVTTLNNYGATICSIPTSSIIEHDIAQQSGTNAS